MNNNYINDLTLEATNFFTNIGITKKLHGTNYLMDVLVLVLDKNHEIDSDLYREIAKIHHDKPQNIERCIRYAKDKSLERMSYDDQIALYGHVVNYESGNIYNFDFINIVVDKIKYNINKKNWLSVLYFYFAMT